MKRPIFKSDSKEEWSLPGLWIWEFRSRFPTAPSIETVLELLNPMP